MNRFGAAALVFVAALPRPVAAQLTTRVQASGFTLPVDFVQDPTDRDVQFVVQQDGHIRVIRAGIVQPADFLDLSSATEASAERGLLGLAFPPDAATSRRFFVDFTDLAGNTVVARFTRSRTNPLIADPASRFDLRWAPDGATTIAQPYANHNGGHLVFGPDGFLYVGMGDGGSANDPEGRAQNPGELLGKILRIDVAVPDDDRAGYRVPPDNPFVDGLPVAARPEIWDVGVRNPWRFSFDDPARGGTGGLLVADVGQNRWEEIDYEPAGAGGRNYGWRNREGAHDNVTSLPPSFVPLIDPVYEYGHDVGDSITGGFVYRGSELGPSYTGRYFFADFVRGRVWSLALSVGNGEAQASSLIEHTAELGGGALGNLSSFGVDASGELYLVGYSTGTILKIVGAGRPPAAPTNLRILPP
jgi:glucose/arabinose dehydrogenase